MSFMTIIASALLVLTVAVFNSAEGRACVGCFQEISVDDKSLKKTLNMALTLSNAKNVKVVKIIKAERQVVAGFNYKVTFAAKIQGKGEKVCQLNYYDGLRGKFQVKSMNCK